MKPAKFILMASLLLAACGSDNGGAGGNGSSLSAGALAKAKGLTDKAWVIPVNSTLGQCGMGATLFENGRFNLAFTCQFPGPVFRYELVTGTYSLNDTNLTLTADRDECSDLNTFYWDGLSSINTETFRYTLTGNELILVENDDLDTFRMSADPEFDGLPFTASRGCLEQSGMSFTYIPYSVPTTKNMGDVLRGL